jgi:hypothetical protein
VHRIEEALDRKRTAEEGEESIARGTRRMSIMLERIHQGEDDTF